MQSGFSKSQILFTSAGASILFTILALTGAILANSVTLWTNATRVLLESFSMVLAYYTVWKSQRVSIEVFNYGLGKLESLVSLFASIVILIGFLLVGWAAIMRLQNPVAMEGAGFGLVVLILASLYNAWMYIQMLKLKRSEDSPVVDSQHVIYLIAIIASVISLTTVFLSVIFREQTWAGYLDSLGAMLLCYFLLRSGMGLMKRSLTPLLDGAIEESQQMLILRGLVDHFENYEQLSRIRTRRSGDRVFIEIFLSFAADLKHQQVLQRMDAIKSLIEKEIPSAEVWIIPHG